MSSRQHAASRLLAGFALATLSLTTLAEAQPYGPRRGGTDHMIGPAMMDRQLFGRMCGPRTAGLAEWRLDRLERVIKPTDAQRAKFDEFKAASNKAAEAMRAACPHRCSDDDGRSHGSHGETARSHAARGEDGAACA